MQQHEVFCVDGFFFVPPHHSERLVKTLGAGGGNMFRRIAVGMVPRGWKGFFGGKVVVLDLLFIGVLCIFVAS